MDPFIGKSNTSVTEKTPCENIKKVANEIRRDIYVRLQEVRQRRHDIRKELLISKWCSKERANLKKELRMLNREHDTEMTIRLYNSVVRSKDGVLNRVSIKNTFEHIQWQEIEDVQGDIKRILDNILVILPDSLKKTLNKRISGMCSNDKYAEVLKSFRLMTKKSLKIIEEYVDNQTNESAIFVLFLGSRTTINRIYGCCGSCKKTSVQTILFCEIAVEV